MPLAIDVQRPGFFASSSLSDLRMTPHSSGSLAGVERRHLAGLLVLGRLVHEQRRVAAVVDDQRGALAVRPHQALDRAPPVLVERLTLPREHRDAARVGHRAAGLGPADDDRRRGVVLRREDVARHPAHVGAEQRQRLDEHAGLNRHVQAAHDPRAGERLLALVALADGHQSGHFALGQPEFLAAELRQVEIRDLVGDATRLLGQVVCVHFARCCCHACSPLVRLTGLIAPVRPAHAVTRRALP